MITSFFSILVVCGLFDLGKIARLFQNLSSVFTIGFGVRNPSYCIFTQTSDNVMPLTITLLDGQAVDHEVVTGMVVTTA